MVTHLLFISGKTEEHGSSLDGKQGRQARLKPTWNTGFLWTCALSLSLHALPLCRFPCHSQVSLSSSQKTKSLALFLPLLPPWHLPEAFELLGKQAHCLVLHDISPLASCGICVWKEKRKKSDSLNGSSPSLRPSGILITKACCSLLSRVWTDSFILLKELRGQLSLLEPPFTQNNFF